MAASGAAWLIHLEPPPPCWVTAAGVCLWPAVRCTQVGSSVTIYGRRIELCDADAFTHSFAASRGQEQGPARPYPLDPIQQYRAEKSVPSGGQWAGAQEGRDWVNALQGRGFGGGCAS